MSKFFTADTHFGLNDYEGIVLRDFRPFDSVQEMNYRIVELWNNQALKGDVIYHLGDFVNYNHKDNLSYDECFDIVKKINAKVVLILGNNEKRLLNDVFGGDFEKFKGYLLNKGFFEVYENDLELEMFGKKFYLNHFPKNHKDGYINLFAHVHGCCFVKRYGFNVGIDNHYLSLFSESDLERLVDCMKYYDENVYD